jgi:hypothetical protein
MNRLFFKHWIKDRYNIPRDRNDGLLSDLIIHDCINDAIKQVADDCHALPVIKRFPIRAGQWKYPMPEDVIRIAELYFIDSDGTRVPLDYCSREQFLAWRDPTDDTATDPEYYSYAEFASKVIQFYGKALPVYDYISSSHITSGTIRTVVDTGANFGLTLDGTHIAPGFIVQNLTDGSYGYVEVLDTNTNKTSGTATTGTGNNLLEDTGKNFTSLGVEAGDIICTPSTGAVTSYAFVKTVGTTTLVYEDYHDPDGSTARFAANNTYKIGKAQKIRLSMDTPHPGLREGAANVFTVGTAKVTITGTTFTSTSVTGSSTSGAEVGDTAIASGGSHGQVSAFAANSLTVDMWIGGTPLAGETVICYECDEYQIEGEYRTQRMLWLGPTPTTSDTLGTENIEVLYHACPEYPKKDTDLIELDEHYRELLQKAVEWKAGERTGKQAAEVAALKQLYDLDVRKYQGDIYGPPLRRPLTVWGNRNLAARRGVKDQTPNGVKWDLPA